MGRDLDVAAAKTSARWAALTLLEYLWHELGGTLAPVRQFVSLTGYVASAEGFHDQAEVMNGASAVLTEVFGRRERQADAFRHRRSPYATQRVGRASAGSSRSRPDPGAGGDPPVTVPAAGRRPGHPLARYADLECRLATRRW